MIPLLRSTLSLEIDGEMAETGYGVGEAEQNNLTELENTIKLNELPLMHSLGEDKLTEIFLIGKRTLRFICSDSERL